MNRLYIKYSLYFLPLLMSITGCREDELVVPTEYDIVGEAPDPNSKIRGFYLVNEGNMGSNKCTLDYMDYFTGLYARNFYAERNPNVIKELGDVGNDIGVYGSKLYVVVNCSHKVEVLDARSGIRLGQIDIPNCRYVRFHRGNAYVSSYVGPVLIDANAPKGAVYQIDTLSLAVTDKVTVGYQPEEMEIVGDYMYVANSASVRQYGVGNPAHRFQAGEPDSGGHKSAPGEERPTEQTVGERTRRQQNPPLAPVRTRKESRIQPDAGNGYPAADLLKHGHTRRFALLLCNRVERFNRF